jgi:hypothetical protein
MSRAFLLQSVVFAVSFSLLAACAGGGGSTFGPLPQTDAGNTQNTLAAKVKTKPLLFLQILGSTSYTAGTVASVPTSGHDIMYFNSSGSYVDTQLAGSTFRSKLALTGLVVNPSLPGAIPLPSPFKMTDYQWAIQAMGGSLNRPLLPVHFVSAQTLTAGPPSYTITIPAYDEYDLFNANGVAGFLDVLRDFTVSATVDTATAGMPLPMTALVVHPEYSNYAADPYQEFYQMILQTSGAAAGDNGGINT